MREEFKVLTSSTIENRPVVIGSGPSGAMAAFTLCAMGQRPIVIDSELFMPRSDEEELKLNSMKSLKSYFGSFATYYQNLNSDLSYASDLSVRHNFTFGGFSRVWGGTLDFFHDMNEWQLELRPSQQDFDLVRQCLGEPNLENYNKRYTSEFKLESGKIISFKEYEACDSLLAVTRTGKNSCENNRLCLTGCPNDSIWFAGNVIDKLIKSDMVDYYPGYFLNTIESSGSGSILHFIDPSGQSFETSPDKCFLGLGPIGTASLLIRSGFKDEIIIPDNHTIFTGAIKMKKLIPSGNTLSKWWMRKRTFPQVAIQIYEPDDRNIQRLISLYPFFKKFPKVAKFITSRIHPMIIYIDSSISNSMVMSRKDNGLFLHGQNQKRNNFYARIELLKLMFELARIRRLFPFFIGKLSKPGAGYHSGAFLKLGEDVDSLGQIAKSVHIVDSSVLPNLRPGSITPTIMLNCARIVRTCYEKST